MTKKKVLGKGLSALIPDTTTIPEEELVSIDISLIKPSPNQPRTNFDEKSLRELAKSIEESGMLQPIIVRKMGEKYELVVGERRYRAVKMSGLNDIPAIVKDISDREAIQMALIENIHREDLNPVEEAIAYKYLLDEYDLRQEDIAKLVGRSRPYITNSLRLLTLPEEVKEMLVAGEITSGHARALLSLVDEKTILKYARSIIKEGMTVRAVEKLSLTATDSTSSEKEKKRRKKITSDKTEIALRAVIETLQKTLSREVKIFYNKGKGKIVLEFYSDDDLNNLLDELGYKGGR